MKPAESFQAADAHLADCKICRSQFIDRILVQEHSIAIGNFGQTLFALYGHERVARHAHQPERLVDGGPVTRTARIQQDLTVCNGSPNLQRWARRHLRRTIPKTAQQRAGGLCGRAGRGKRHHAAVADIGSGTGYFAMRLARALPGGRVFGADLEPDMVRYLNERAAREKLLNLSSHVAAADEARIPAPVDLALVVDTYHHIGQRERYFSRLKQSLKPRGRVAIVDFKPDSPVGPPRRHRIAASTVVEEMARAGYAREATPDFLPYQYLLIFTPR